MSFEVVSGFKNDLGSSAPSKRVEGGKFIDEVSDPLKFKNTAALQSPHLVYEALRE